MLSRAEIMSMRPSQAFARLQGLRRDLRDSNLDADGYDAVLGLLEEQLARGTVVDAGDVMAIAQEVEYWQGNDGAMIDSKLVAALIAGLAAVTGASPLPA